MDFWSDIWSVFVWFFWAYIFIAYLFALFAVVADIFRDHNLSGWLKAVWIFFLIFLPILTVLVYVIARGGSMSERYGREVAQNREETDTYIREVAGSSSADEIAKAKTLLDSGSISQAEFESLKAKALRA
ncbi:MULTISPECIES: SHOCT domain-containing protein [unclassified Salinibacterium]|uniref:SHOCT domain-containing protein n=1 Tax=unclassified Salinibacterium TaxID=2632331 RepID=UPI001421831B|nr:MULTISPECIES: SHOCT domain-containing protein [unclassified Salinibacterium]